MRIRQGRIGAVSALLAGLLPPGADAHHSVSAWFDRDGRQEIEGVITEVRWENPHVIFFMRAPTGSGDEGTWEIETFSVSGISRWGITEDMLGVGDRVRVSGWPSRRGLDNIFARNVLLPTGQELTFGGEPLYSDDALLGLEFVDATEGVAADPELGIFRVWSQGRGAGWLFPEGFVPGFDVRSYPLTSEAIAAFALTEPGAGSSLGDVVTLAERKDDTWALTKTVAYPARLAEAGRRLTLPPLLSSQSLPFRRPPTISKSSFAYGYLKSASQSNTTRLLVGRTSRSVHSARGQTLAKRFLSHSPSKVIPQA